MLMHTMMQPEPLERRLQLVKEIVSQLQQYQISSDQLYFAPDSPVFTGGYAIVRVGQLRKNRNGSVESRDVAVKQVRAIGNLDQRASMTVAFARELKMWAGLSHRHVLPFLGFFLAETLEEAWLISPYLAKGNVRNYLALVKPDIKKRLELVYQTAVALAYVHELGLCHGDIKTENVLISDEEEAVVCDFGLTKSREASGLTMSTGIRGTMRYMSPELFNGEATNRDARSDVWAWGCVAHEIISDQPPYASSLHEGKVLLRIMQQEQPATLDDADLSEGMKALLRACWSYEPSVRPSMAFCAEQLGDPSAPVHESLAIPDALAPLSRSTTPTTPKPTAGPRTAAESFQTQLAQLEAMGFTNLVQNMQALLATDGKLSLAIEFILAGAGLD